jgi:APA family basic amino acid/polyamine antiporter
LEAIIALASTERISCLVAGLAPFGTAVAISSFGTLLYYTVTNISALRLSKEQRTFPRLLAFAGLAGCLGLAFSLAVQDVAAGHHSRHWHRLSSCEKRVESIITPP